MDLSLSGKAALLTGASRGLGFATAQVLAGEGAHIAINSRDPNQLSAARNKLDKFGGEVIALPGDVMEPNTPQKLVKAAADAFGGLDLLFTNASGPPPGAFEEIKEDAWQKAFS